jgi:4-hydroxybutyryl-CoA dehydratase/vinylacetyl-CoA-Delta-isomerase
MNAVTIVCGRIDRKFGTHYSENVNAARERLKKNDLSVVAAVTDVKGDRSLRPSQQKDPDLYVRVAEKRKDGIIVRGAKAHQTGAVNSHEIIVMPTLAMSEEDKDYAVSFSTPSDAEGVFHVIGRQVSDTRRLEGGEIDLGNARYAGHEALIVFDDVFVPWDRVFMCGEREFSGALVERFASYHRQNYGGCKTGLGDVLIGAAATMAEYNGRTIP